MKRTIPCAAVLLVCGSLLGANYVNNFEAEALGTLPAPFTVATPWGDWAPGPVTAEVAAAPGGGQAMKVVWGTDWANYGASSGELDCTLDMTGIDPATAILSVSYDFYKQNWRVWQVFGDQSWFPPGGLHMNDNPTLPNEMVVGTDDYNNTTQHLYDVPENAWVHVASAYDAGTGVWQTAVTYGSGTGGGTFGGTYATPNPVAGQYWWGGWAFQSTMGGQDENVLYIDNLNFGVTPEPASLLLIGLAALVLRRR